MSAPETEAATVAALAKASVAPLQLFSDPDHAGIVVLNNGTIKNLEAYGSKPARKRAQVVLHEARSFIAYINAHKASTATALFGSASETGGSFNGIIDYHQKAQPAGEEPSGTFLGTPGWGEHHVQFNLQMTKEWLTWVEGNDRFMSQVEFCDFIEDNMLDILDPDGASMLEIVQLIQGTKGVTFKSGKNLKNGAIDFTYTEEISTTGRRDAQMQVPDRFTLGLVPFVGALGVKMGARLRYNIGSSGQLSFKYILNRPHQVIDDAFAATRDVIEAETKLPVLLGNAHVKQPAV